MGQIRMRAICSFVILGLAACSYSVPVTGEFAGKPALGTATAASGGGTFFVTQTNGFRCEGTYDALTFDITITAPVTCNDGRTGRAIISRKPDLVGGTVIVELNDGNTGQFVFGDLSFAQEFR